MLSFFFFSDDVFCVLLHQASERNVGIEGEEKKDDKWSQTETARART